MAELEIRAYGACIGVHLDDELVDELRPRLEPATTNAAASDTATPDEVVRIEGGDAGGSVTSESGGNFDCADREELLRVAASQVHLCVAVHAKDVVFVHAGAVAWRGRGIVLPGRSMAGKTTLTRALVTAGAQYCSDEYAVLDAEGMLHPYPKPMSVRVPGGPSRVVPPDQVGDVASGPVPVGLVLATRHHDGAEWDPTTLDRSTGALALVDNAVVASVHPVLTLDVAAATVARARCLQGDRPDADRTAAQILSVLDEVIDGATTT